DVVVKQEFDQDEDGCGRKGRRKDQENGATPDGMDHRMQYADRMTVNSLELQLLFCLKKKICDQMLCFKQSERSYNQKNILTHVGRAILHYKHRKMNGGQ